MWYFFYWGRLKLYLVSPILVTMNFASIGSRYQYLKITTDIVTSAFIREFLLNSFAITSHI